jgi:4-amino-4-deoxy-L-arabinose transferase-like glycosyltransferase
MTTARRRGPGGGGGAGDRASRDAGQSSLRGSETRAGSFLAGRPAAGALLLLFGAILFVAYVRLRLVDVPLERDEGEYAYTGQLILEGIAPYQLAYNMKFPGTYYAYAALLAVFGETTRGIRTGLLVVSTATILLVFLLGRRIIGEFPAAVGAAAYALLSVDIGSLSLLAHATHFAVLAVVGGFLLLLRAIDARRSLLFALAGALLGSAVLMKQHAVFYLPLGAALALWSGLRREGRDPRAATIRTAWLIAGATVPPVVIGIVFALQGVLGKFLFWTFQYAREYVSLVPLSLAPELFGINFGAVLRMMWPMWLLGAIGLVALWVVRWDSRARAILTGLLIASALAIVPGFYFREHYFIMLFPVVALLVGVTIAAAESLFAWAGARGPARGLAALVFLAAAGLSLAIEGPQFFFMSPREISRGRYANNPFIEAVELGSYIRQRTSPDDRIAVIGSEPEIYFYADRKSATGYIYMYPLMEPQKYAGWMQSEMIREVEAAHPKYLVFVKIQFSWLMRAESDRTIVRWAERYARDCYDIVGVADMQSPERTRYVWEGEAAAYQPSSGNLVMTFRRRSDALCTVSGRP